VKKVLGCLRRADDDFEMIAPDDVILLGISGGKDSLCLLEAMARYRKFSKKAFTLHAVTLSMGYEPFDVTGIREMCQRLEVPFHYRPTQIGPIIFEERREKSPCSLCAKMRRGILHDTARELGCNKVALGHHRDDAIETLLLSLLYEGRLHTFQPVTYLSRKEITVIRPLIYAAEKHILGVSRKLNFPVVKNPCPVDGATRRQDMKELIRHMEKLVPDAPEKMLAALQNMNQYGLWDKSYRSQEDQI
jgi:tRNA 2-thiocytidine biosynthesis protein TtcA